MPAKKQTRKLSAKKSTFSKFKDSSRFKWSKLALISVIFGVAGYLIIKSFAATGLPKNALVSRFCGTWLLQQVDSAPSANLTNNIKHGLDYQDMRGLSLRTNWKTIDNNGALNPAVLDAGKSIIAGYPGQSYSIRVIAGSKSPDRLFSQPDMYLYHKDDGKPVPLPYNPNSATFAPNTGFEREYTKLVDNIINYAAANNIKLVHMPWYGRDWAEINYHPELWDEPNFTPDKWVEGHKRLADIVYNKVKNYPDISVEFPASGWNNLVKDNTSPYNIGPTVTNEVIGYLVNPIVHPLWANYSGRLFIQGNGYGVHSGLNGASSPTTREAYRGMQMFDQTNRYSTLWTQLYDNLDNGSLYGTYLEVYTESFGYDNTNQENLQKEISDFHNRNCVAAPTDNSAPQVSVANPKDGTDVTDPTTIDVSASDDIGVTKVEMYADGSLLASDTTAPYSHSWPTSGISAGSHNLYAKAYDASGKVSTSTSVNVTKPSPNKPPSLSFSSPTGGATYTAPASITFNASASDSDGQVTKVEFYSDAIKIGEATSAPYNFTWQAVAAGTYNFSARAYDDKGAVTVIAPVTVTVNAQTVSVPSPTDLALSLSWDWGRFQVYMNTTWAAPSDSSNVGGYKVQVLARGAPKESATLGASANSYKIYNLTSGANYQVQVSSVGLDGVSASTPPTEKSATLYCFLVCLLK